LKVYLVTSAQDVTGRCGYARALLDASHPNLLVSFADQGYKKRQDMVPPKNHPMWNKTHPLTKGPIKQ
jgi:hypothetical protein